MTSRRSRPAGSSWSRRRSTSAECVEGALDFSSGRGEAPRTRLIGEPSRPRSRRRTRLGRSCSTSSPTPSSSPRGRGRPRRRRESARTSPTRKAKIRCAGTGIGIPPTDRPLFHSFSQVDASTTRRYGGTGLGPGDQQAPGRADGRRIGIESELGVGTRSTSHAPRPAAGAPSLARPKGEQRSRGSACWSSTTTPPTAASLTQLGAWGMPPRATHRAVRRRSAGRRRRAIRLRVLDMHMPGMDGVARPLAIARPPARPSARDAHLARAPRETR